jgi:polysaccharide biosynthesis transport protein
MDASRREPRTLRDYLQVIRRRKWVILLAVVAAPLVSVLLAMRQQPLYAASADVLLSRQSLANTLDGTQDPTAYLQAERFAQTQVDLAGAPDIAQRTLLALALPDRTAAEILAEIKVTARANADMIDFRAVDPSPSLAQRIATAYAQQYIDYKAEIDSLPLKRAEAEVQRHLDTLERAGDSSSAFHKSLVDKLQDLKTREALLTPAILARPANDGVKVQPRPMKSAVIGLVLGLLGGLGLAFLWEALDTRVRTAESVSEQLGLSLLARLPTPGRKYAGTGKLLMLEEPNDDQAEAFRMLRTNLEFANLDRGARTIMVTSAVAGEGKSTTVANLAAALARGGRHVVLVDLDLRKPSLHKFFDLGGKPGLTNVALGRARLEEALVQVPISDGSSNLARLNGGSGRVPGTLEVLGTGPLPPNPGEFVGTRALQDVLASLTSRAHLVLIDAPPLLSLGDALALTAKVDALFVVSRLKVVRRQLIDELKRVLETCRAHKLGFVVTGANADSAYGYGYGHYGDSEPVPPVPDALERVREARSA